MFLPPLRWHGVEGKNGTAHTCRSNGLHATVFSIKDGGAAKRHRILSPHSAYASDELNSEAEADIKVQRRRKAVRGKQMVGCA